MKIWNPYYSKQSKVKTLLMSQSTKNVSYLEQDNHSVIKYDFTVSYATFIWGIVCTHPIPLGKPLFFSNFITLRVRVIRIH